MDSPESVSKIPEFVRTHNIDITEIDQELDSFQCFNDFFYRKLKPGARPIAYPGNPNVAVSPADCRLNLFPLMADAGHFWVKGRDFTVASLLAPCPVELISKMQACALMICRLAPQDYHRWHMPVKGKIVRSWDAGSTLYTVNPIAVRTEFNVYTENKRRITLLETKEFGEVVLVAIGATCVGSIQNTLGDGDEFDRGDEHGYFAFGGSTCLVLFQKGTVRFDESIVRNTSRCLETLVKMGRALGCASPEADDTPGNWAHTSRRALPRMTQRGSDGD